MEWDGSRCVVTETESYDYYGSVALYCGASAGQTQAEQAQTTLTNQIMQQGQQVFGNSSQVFSDLTSSLAPTVAAGPNQQGFSQAELANLNSQAVTNSGVAYRNAAQAVGEAQSAQNGGNVGNVTSGSTTGTNLSVAEGAAQNTANQLGQISEANYATGRQNYDTALSGLAAAPNVYNAATGVDNAATNSAEGEANTANQIATQNNSWMQAVSGALGGVAGAVASGGMKNLGSGESFFGGSSANVPAGSGSASMPSF